MGQQRKRERVDQATGEVIQDDLLDFPEVPMFETSEQALRTIRNQQDRVDRLEATAAEAKLEAKEAALTLENEQSKLRQMLRALRQLKMFQLLLVAVGLVALLLGCAPAGAQGQIPGGTLTGWDDDYNMGDRFDVELVEAGVGVVIDTRTGRGWLIVGSTQSWQAIEPLGQL